MSTIITDLPSPADPSTFNAKALNAWTQLAALSTELNAVSVTASDAAAAAALAVAATGAPAWVSGTTYAIGDCRWSPVTRFVYRRITAGAGTTDPSLDSTNWVLASAATPPLSIITASTVTAVAFVHYVLAGALQQTLTLPAAPAAGDAVLVTVVSGRTDGLIARNGKLLQGSATDMTLNDPNFSRTFRFLGDTYGWRAI